MIGLEKKRVEKRELRHRVKQTPFRKLIRAVEGKAGETGSAVFYVSSFRNSKVCPIHFVLLKNGGGWHALHCPRGHVVDRDAAAVLNMLWKTTPNRVGEDGLVGSERRGKEAGEGERARAERLREEEKSACSMAGRIRRLGFAQVVEGQPPVARGAGPGRPHDPRPRRR